MMIEHCPAARDLLALAESEPGEAGDEGLTRHAASCPRCRSLLAAYGGFTAMASRESRRDEEQVVARLRASLEKRILGQRPSPERRARRGIDRREGWLRLLVPACGAAAILLAAFLVFRSETDRPSPVPVLREGPGVSPRTAVLALPVQVLPDGRIMLAWNRVPTADSYRVRILDAGLRELAALAAGPDTSLVLDPPSVVGGEPSAAYWQVEALFRGDRVGDSVPKRLPTPSNR